MMRLMRRRACGKLMMELEGNWGKSRSTEVEGFWIDVGESWWNSMEGCRWKSMGKSANCCGSRRMLLSMEVAEVDGIRWKSVEVGRG